VRLLILLVGVIVLILMWTNPDRSDFEKWVQKKEVTNFQRSTPLQPVNFRSKSYLFFSIHELSVVRQQTEFMTEYNSYIGVGILGMIFPTSTPDVDGRKSPGTNTPSPQKDIGQLYRLALDAYMPIDEGLNGGMKYIAIDMSNFIDLDDSDKEQILKHF
jgi:hypothetical protein